MPSFAIIAASDILVTIPPVVSWGATENSTVHEKTKKSTLCIQRRNSKMVFDDENKLWGEIARGEYVYN